MGLCQVLKGEVVVVVMKKLGECKEGWFFGCAQILSKHVIAHIMNTRGGDFLNCITKFIINGLTDIMKNG